MSKTCFIVKMIVRPDFIGMFTIFHNSDLKKESFNHYTRNLKKREAGVLVGVLNLFSRCQHNANSVHYTLEKNDKHYSMYSTASQFPISF